ncbi:lysine-specific demethylase 6A [Ditylenchus destructor]|uniref:Lysine-specific demethylase 6A n=1 Tax=Ditylenchus destructor TaxID=166010 RepID=A0AAD4QYM1_9BILA|nr:lysine-specific demethylase 6A [Ditylenchus destructor]
MTMDEGNLSFRKDEIGMLSSFTSFNFAKFTQDVKECLPEKFLLFKACRIYEDELIALLMQSKGALKDTEDEERERKAKLCELYLKLGHVNLLAQDYARALSAYQKAYKLNEADYWKDPSGLYGLGLTYFHFRAYQP